MNGLIEGWRAWSERRQILKAIRRERSDNYEKLKFMIKDELTYALAALERNDNRHAAGIWAKLLAGNPEAARRSPLALSVLFGLGRFEEAETLLRERQKKHPGDPQPARGLAQLMLRKCDWNATLRECQTVRKRFPGVIEGYTMASEALRALNRLDEAHDLALQTIKRFPNDLVGYLEHARVMMLLKDWDAALSIWQRVREEFGFFGGWVGGAQALAELQRYDEADALLLAARFQFGTEYAIHMEYARVSEKKGDIPQAIERWKSVLYRFPLEVPVISTVADALERLGEPAEAEVTLRAAVERFETEPRPLSELAKLYHFQRHDYPAAAEAWGQLRERFPDNEEAYTRGAEALDHAGRRDEAEALRAEHKARFNR